MVALVDIKQERVRQGVDIRKAAVRGARKGLLDILLADCRHNLIELDGPREPPRTCSGLA